MNSDNQRRRPQERKRPPTSNYYRSGAGPAGQASPFEAKLNAVSPLKRIWLKTIDILMILVLIFLVFHSLILRSNAKIIVNNTNFSSISNYRDVTNGYLRAVKNNNKLTFDDKGLINTLKTDFPEIDTASVELPVFSQRPVVRIAISPPSFFLKSADKTYILDAAGKAVAYNYQYPRITGLPVIVDQSGFTVSRGKQVLSQHDISFIKDLQAHCEANSIKIKSLVLPASPEEADLYTEDQPYFVKFHLAGDPDIQTGQFLAARHNFAQNNVQPSQYLDVRVSGKIFYK
jgi:hypothetical protein